MKTTKEEREVMRGIVRFFNDSAGYGFISSGDRTDIFVHYTQIEGAGMKSLSVGDKVKFDMYETAKGFEAVNVKKED